MKNKLKFIKKKQLEKLNKPIIDAYDLEDVINELEALLKVNSYLLSFCSICGMVNGSFTISPDTPTEYLINGIYLDQKDLIVIPLSMGHVDENKRLIFQKATREQMIFHLAHEMRHRYQFMYEREKYYNDQYTFGNDTLYDESEIDADAFAFAFLQKNNIAFDEKKFAKQFLYDYQRRYNLAKKIIKKE